MLIESVTTYLVECGSLTWLVLYQCQYMWDV